MRICVCGLGKVGKPILDTLRAKGFVAVGYDIDPTKTEATVEEAAALTDAAIFIVPTPSLEDGSFSNAYLVAALGAFRKVAPKNYLYIISSTTVPGSCERFRSIVGDNICYKPEFIRLAHVREDLVAPHFVLIGEGSREAGVSCESIYKRISNAPIKRMSLTEAELAKITLNCALTMKVSLANQLHLVAGKLGVDSEKIMDAVGSDPRIGRAYLQPGWPYGGPCLPRDNRMFQFVAQKCGTQAPLSMAADIINDRILGPEKEGWTANANDLAYQPSS